MQDSYRELFLSESEEYLNTINQCLVKLEDNPNNLESLHEIFRCMHTLKGMSATMGFEKLTQLSHQVEDLLDDLRNQKKKLSREIMDALFAAVDVVQKLFEEIKAKKESTVEIGACLNTLKQLFAEDVALKTNFSTAPAVNGNKIEVNKKEFLATPGETVELTVEDLRKIQDAKSRGLLHAYTFKIVLAKDCMMKEARIYLVFTNFGRIGELIKFVPDAESLKSGKFEHSFLAVIASKDSGEAIRREILGISEVEEVTVTPIEKVGKTSQEAQSAPSAAYVKKIQSMRIPVERLDKIMNLMGELAITKIRLQQIVQTHKIEPVEEVSFIFDRLISELQDEIMQTRLLPVAYILDTFPRVVRDLAHREGKEIDLEIAGSEIELDRVVLDEIGDPLIHLVRNAIDHGLELPADRVIAGKSAKGKLEIKVSRQKGQIFIEVADDGNGVDFEAVKKKAIAKELISVEDAALIDEKRVLELISLPGFSTASKITDISGRGVGLDVVKTKIEALGGRLEFESKKGVGSRFILTLPLTLAIIKAMLVRVGKEIFAVPLMSVRETIKISEEDIRIVQNLEITKVRNELIPIVRLSKELGIKLDSTEQKESDKRLSVVIVEYGKKVMGFVVSQVVGEQDIVVKSLGALIKKTKGISGATILGDGRVALILDAGLR